MRVVCGIDPNSFDALINLKRFPPDEFVLTTTDVIPSLKLPDDSLAGWVTVKRRSTGVARTYSAGVGYNWLAAFKYDLDAGVFGKPGAA